MGAYLWLACVVRQRGAELAEVRSARPDACCSAALVLGRDSAARIIMDFCETHMPSLPTMPPRSLWAAGHVCLRCQWRLALQRPRNAARVLHARRGSPACTVGPTLPGRGFHAAAQVGLLPCPATHPLPATLTRSSAHSPSSRPRPSTPPPTPSSCPDRPSCPSAATSRRGKPSMAARARRRCLPSKSTRHTATCTTTCRGFRVCRPPTSKPRAIAGSPAKTTTART